MKTQCLTRSRLSPAADGEDEEQIMRDARNRKMKNHEVSLDSYLRRATSRFLSGRQQQTTREAAPLGGDSWVVLGKDDDEYDTASETESESSSSCDCREDLSECLSTTSSVSDVANTADEVLLLPLDAPNSRRRRVRFASHVQVRDYALTLGILHTNKRFPLSLDWQHGPAREMEISSGTGASLHRLSTRQRLLRLLDVTGLTEMELAQLEDERHEQSLRLSSSPYSCTIVNETLDSADEVTGEGSEDDHDGAAIQPLIDNVGEDDENALLVFDDDDDMYFSSAASVPRIPSTMYDFWD